MPTISLLLIRRIARSQVTLCAQSLTPLNRLVRCLLLLSSLFVFACLRPKTIWAQCAGIASTPGAAADCAAHAIPPDTVAKLDPAHPYTLAELIDIAEHNNPRTRIVWERAKQEADELGIAKSAYYPVLAGLAAFSHTRIAVPFPKPLAPRGYT